MTQYIVFDLEFNHELPIKNLDEEKKQCPFEIIQIGALKLDVNFNTIATFSRNIKPTIYPQVNSYITDLTGITTEQLLTEQPFPEVFKDYMNFIGEDDSVLCVWGMADIKELFRNVQYHKLDKKLLPEMFINIQPYTSIHFGIPQTKLFNLQGAVEALKILMPYKFHNALYDAYYTAEIFKKIKNPAIKETKYDPNYVSIRPKQPKKSIDFEKLLQQFEKMYNRKLTQEEQNMIVLAYKMGKTHQFIK